MKKKISLLGLVLLLVFSLAGCGSSEDGTAYDEAALQEQAITVMTVFEMSDASSIDELCNESDLVVDLTLLNTGLKIESDDFRSMWEAWQAGQEECGAILDIEWKEMEVTSDGVKVVAEFEGETRSGELEFAFSEKSYMESMTINAEYSLSEILTKAGLNTVLGMGTVFVVLIFISFIISLFGYIPALEKKLKGGKKKTAETPEKPAAPTPAAAPVAAPAPATTDDTELVAVISAAIAAAEGTSADGFIVRSIKRRKSNKWN